MNGCIVTIDELATRIEALRYIATHEMSPRFEHTRENRAYVTGFLAALDAVARMHSIRVQRVVEVSEPWHVVEQEAIPTSPLFEMIRTGDEVQS